MKTRFPIALLVTLGCFLSVEFTLGGEADIAVRALMSRTELAKLEHSYTELSTLKSKGSLTEEEQSRLKSCLASITDENQKRKKLFDLLEEGGNLADYPGILEKVRISYNTSTFGKPDAYEMFVFPAVGTNESDVFMWLRVDLRGKILKKVHTFTGAE